jgi:ASC-1-like (ASCH) protein
MFVFNLQQKWYNLLLSGEKTVEGRMAKEKYKKLKIGDKVLMADGLYAQEFVILDIRKYKSVKDFISCEGLSTTLPGVKTMKEGIDIYLEFYDEKEVEKLGFLAFEVKRV